MNYSKPAMLILTLILSLAFVYFIIFGGFGAAASLYVLIYYAIILGYAKAFKIKLRLKSFILLIPIFLTASCFILYDNGMLKFLNALFLFALVLLQTTDMFGACVYPLFSLNTLLDLGHTSIILPFFNIGSVFCTLKQFSGSKERLKVLYKVLLGILIAIPFMVIVTSLLISYDTAFAGVMTLISNTLTNNLTQHLFKIGLAIILTLFLFALLDGLEKKLNFLPKKTTLQIPPIIDPIISITFSNLIGVIYIIYCFSQLAYFVSAFKMILPDTFTFAEYTRKGFFELVPLSMFNIALIYSLSKLTRFTESKVQVKWGHVNSIFITLFNLFLIASTLFKMIMYVSSYGLTPLRVYTTWFIILLAVLFLITLAKLFASKVKAFKCFYISFIILFLGLNFIDTDKLIARYNIHQYTSGMVKELDYNLFYNLSDSAVPEVIKLLELNDPSINYEVNAFLNERKSNYSNRSWTNFNFSTHKAKKITN